MPEVSIIIPTYNRAHILPRAIQSILNQTFQNFEIIIVDDGSTDHTGDVLEAFDDKRIIYAKQTENKGEAIARNIGIAMAKGKYIAFQDSDDESLPERIEDEVRILDGSGNGVGIVYSNMLRIDKNGNRIVFKSPHLRPQDEMLYPRGLKYFFKNIGIGSSMIRAECFAKVGHFDSSLKYFVDMDFFIRASKYYAFFHIEKSLLNYYEEASSLEVYLKIIDARKAILAKYLGDIQADNLCYSLHLFNIGNDMCYVGQVAEGRYYLYKAIELYPLNAKYYCGLVLSMLGGKAYHDLIDLKNRIIAPWQS